MQTEVQNFLKLACGSAAVLFVAACGAVAPASSDSAESENAAAAERVRGELATPTPDRSILIDQIVLATELDDDGAPVEERVALPVNVPVAYLAVLVRGVERNTEFEAEWRLDGETIGWSEHRTREDIDDQQWIALRFSPEGGFSADRYAVHLSVNGSFVESLVFNAGGGRPTQAGSATPRLVFATSWSLEQSSITARTTFEAGTQEVVAVLTNARGQSASLTSHWYHGDEFFAEIASGPVQVSSTRTFTAEVVDPLPPGRYTVSVYDGDVRVATGSFIVEAAPGDETDAVVLDFVVTADINPETRGPAADSVTAVTPPVDLFGMVLVESLSEGDSLEVIWLRSDQEVARSRLAGENVPRNWVTFRYSLPAEEGESIVAYRVVVRLNGVEATQHQFMTEQPEQPEEAEETTEPAETEQPEE